LERTGALHRIGPNLMTSLTLVLFLAAGLGLAAVLTLIWPGRGLLARLRLRRRRMRAEDGLKILLTAELMEVPCHLASVAAALRLSLSAAAAILSHLERLALLERCPDGYCLTPAGRTRAIQVLRAHRLWERHLADETGYGALDWHRQAEDREHFLSLPEVEELAARLRYPSHDPHGDPIPTGTGELPTQPGMPLTAAAAGVPLRVSHVEDEPESVYAELVAAGLHPGTELRILEATPDHFRVRTSGRERLLRSEVAANLTVEPAPEAPVRPLEVRLSDLRPGEQGRVIRIGPGSRPPERRRLRDLGLIRGTLIQTEFASPAGDPVAYRIRGATVALRKEQADQVLVEFEEAGP
jgi:DtxR family Mn-dependent transcriptional regulator